MFALLFAKKSFCFLLVHAFSSHVLAWLFFCRTRMENTGNIIWLQDLLEYTKCSAIRKVCTQKLMHLPVK